MAEEKGWGYLRCYYIIDNMKSSPAKKGGCTYYDSNGTDDTVTFSIIPDTIS